MAFVLMSDSHFSLSHENALTRKTQRCHCFVLQPGLTEDGAH